MGVQQLTINLSDIESGSDIGFVINGVDAGDYAGRPVSAAGDVNGDDIFQINSGIGRDVITDYTSGEDKIKLLGGIKERDLTIREVGSHVRIKYVDDLLAIVQNTIADDLNFI